MKRIIASLLLIGGLQTVNAASLNVSGGILFGASDVDVGGTLYDVSFADGACASVFGQCDNSHFTFTDQTSAIAASHAILDQVLLDGASGTFDASPILTNGCDSNNNCDVYTPYTTYPYPTPTDPNVGLHNALARNWSIQSSDGVFCCTNSSTTFDTTTTAYATWAVWTPVVPTPLPAGFPLLISGLAGIGLVGRRGKPVS